MKLEYFLNMIGKGTCPEGELRIRDIDDFRADDEDLDAILEALKQPNNVRKIFLESNLSASGIQKLAQFLEDNTQIESLELWNPQFGLNNTNDIIESFVPVIQKNKALKRLVLSGVGIEHTNTTNFFKAMEGNSNIEYLSLYYTCFKHPETAQQIARVISNNKTLRTLNLSGHWFEKEALAVIADSLQSNTTLENLDMSGSCVKDEGATLFANVLAKDIHLQSITFFNSEIKAPGAVALANSLVANTHITNLDLGCDSIETEGTLALAKALETNRSLQKLRIGVYSANNEGVKAFADMLEKNTSLTEFDYNSFYTSGDGMDKLRLDMGLTRNKIALLKSQEGQEGSKQNLQKAEKKLAELEYQYENKINPANFSDYLDFRLQAMRAGQRGCCAFPFAGVTKSSIVEDSAKNTSTMKK